MDMRGLGRAQTTLRGHATLSGIGVHTGRPVALTLHPADADCGIYFVRSDLDGGVPANHRFVSATDHCTRLSRDRASVGTVEHLMATLSALEIDNAVVEVNGPEVPIMDGSASAFSEAVDRVGVTHLAAPRRYIKVLKPVRAELGRAFGELRPHDGLRLEIEIDFDHDLIGRQVYSADLSPDLFRAELVRARTFGFLTDVERLWAHGLALGASLDNAIVVGDDHVVNPEGLRFPDEFVRHKALDAIGDLALAGAPILGCYHSYRGGHGLNLRILDTLFADPEAWTFVEVPVRREIGRGDAFPHFAAAAVA